MENAIAMSPEPLPDVAPVSAETVRGAVCEPLQLMRHERRIGRDHDDDRAKLEMFVAGILRRRGGRWRSGRNLRVDRHARDAQIARRGSPAPELQRCIRRSADRSFGRPCRCRT